MVDDLAGEFEVVQPERRGLLAALNPVQTFTQESLDEGLPAATGLSRYWARRSVDGAWGEYRHTLVYIQPGDGSGAARFKTELPSAGRWKLQINIPAFEEVPIAKLGEWSLRIEGVGEVKSVSFDAASAREGWNDVGEYTIRSTQVAVVLSNQTTGMAVIADAVAWLPLDPPRLSSNGF